MMDRSADHGYRPLGWVLALAILALWSCSTPEARYETLSFFFDGVPLPESMRDDVVGEDGNRIAMVVVTHAPFANEQCKDCHGEVRQFSMSLKGYSGVKSNVCLKCHDGTQNEFQAMHGPVAAGECLACHEPHESRYQFLLKARSPKMCLQCHTGEDVQASGAIQHQDLTVDCLSCHHGHGGHEPNYLRIDLAPPTDETSPPVENTPEADTPPDPEAAQQAPEPTGSEAGP